MRIKKPYDPVTVMVLLLALVGAGTLVAVSLLMVSRVLSAKAVLTWTPTVSAVIAAGSLLLAVYSYNRNTNRLRKQLTAEAWEGFMKSRPKVRDLALGSALTGSEAESLIKLRRRDVGSEKNEGTRNEIQRLQVITRVLNGMENLGAGVSSGIYDIEQLRKLGGTMIVRTWRKHEALVHAIRNDAGPHGDLRQPTAFRELEALNERLRRLGSSDSG